MYATRTRQARPEAFAARPSVAERLGLPYMDGALGLGSLALAAISVFVLAEATVRDVPGSPNYFADRQATYAIVGLLAMFLLTRIDYSRFRELRVGIYTFLCGSISLVFVFGFAARGSRRAFELPFFSFQPSELGKLLLVLALAGFVIDGARRGSARQRTVRYLCLGLAPAALVFLQPDLGTSLVYVAITLAVMYVGGVRWTHFATIGAALVALIAVVLVVAPAIGTPILKEYQQQRLTSFADPSGDPSDAGYQQNQAKIAIGSGQVTGADRDLGLVLLVARVAWIPAGIGEGGQPLLLVLLQDRRPDCGSDHEDNCDECDEGRADRREVRPADAPHVHHGEGDCHVHQ